MSLDDLSVDDEELGGADLFKVSSFQNFLDLHGVETHDQRFSLDVDSEFLGRNWVSDDGSLEPNVDISTPQNGTFGFDSGLGASKKPLLNSEALSDARRRPRRDPEKNRSAQVKAKTLQFEETIAKLQAQVAKLVKEKADLQIRCSVLEGLTDAQDAHLDRIRKDKALNDDEEQESILGDAAQLSGDVQGHVVTLQEAKQWTLRDIMRMRQKGLHMEMEWLLSGASDDPSSSAGQQLMKFIMKRRAVNNRIAVGNPKSMQGIYAYEVIQARELNEKPTEALWTRVLDSLQLLQEQQDLLIEAHEILLSCLSVVAEKRRLMLVSPKDSEQQTANALLENLEEERKAVRNFLVCFFDKILSPIQEARCDVYSFPFCPNVLALVHILLASPAPPVILPDVRQLAIAVGVERWPESTPYAALSVPATTRCYILTLQRALFMHRSGAMPIQLPDVPREDLLDMSVLSFGR